MIRLFRYIPLHLLPAAVVAGWISSDALIDTHHGEYAVLCEWLCACDEPWPLREAAE